METHYRAKGDGGKRNVKTVAIFCPGTVPPTGGRDHLKDACVSLAGSVHGEFHGGLYKSLVPQIILKHAVHRTPNEFRSGTDSFGTPVACCVPAPVTISAQFPHSFRSVSAQFPLQFLLVFTMFCTFLQKEKEK